MKTNPLEQESLGDPSSISVSNDNDFDGKEDQALRSLIQKNMIHIPKTRNIEKFKLLKEILAIPVVVILLCIAAIYCRATGENA